jgi:ribose/xylose/arabinose/galactoside ABC-type transport system permease subunit
MKLRNPQSAIRNPQSVDWVARFRPFTGVAALVLLCAIFGSREPAFVSAPNFFNILNSVAIVGILAVGQAFPLLGGGFDLSQGSIAGLCGMVTAGLLSSYGQSVPLAVAGGLASGGALGLVNGLLIARVGINPFVATLGTQIAFSGITLVYCNNQPFSLGPHADLVKQINYGEVGQFSSASLIFLASILLLAFVLRLMPYGQHLYTLGGNEEATRLAGVNTARLKLSTYVLSGLFAALAGIVTIAKAGQASPTAGAGYELQSLASCIIGGIALGGGVGGAWNVLLGALTLQAADTGLRMAVNAPNWRPIIQGAIILLAVAVDARARARRQ